MPRLITLLPCERVIVDRDGMPSLIALFENLHITPSEGQGLAAVPKETVTFKSWAIFCEWEVTSEEITKFNTVDQIFEMEFPDGTTAPVKGKIPFVFQNAGTYRNHQNVFGFPVGQEGTYIIRVWLEKDGARVSDVGTRRMQVIHTLPPGVQPMTAFGTGGA